MWARNLGSNNVDQARQQALARLPIGRVGTATDIAKGIVFLASDDAGFVTGPRRRWRDPGTMIRRAMPAS
jgi:3(or 17)beta-hydroxysteroid dehydrogenase